MQAAADIIASDSAAASLHARLKELRLQRGEEARQRYARRYAQWTAAISQSNEHYRKRYPTPPIIMGADGEAAPGTAWPTYVRDNRHGIGALPRGEQVRRDYCMRSHQWLQAQSAAYRDSVAHLRHRPLLIDSWGYRVDGEDSFAPRMQSHRRVEGPGLGLVDGTFVMVLSPALDTEEAKRLIAKAMSPRVRNAGKKPTRKRIPTVSRKQAAERVAKAIAAGECRQVA